MSVSKTRRVPVMIAVMVVTAVLLLVISALSVKAEDSWISEASASLSGDGTSESPYLISSPEDLAYLSKQVNSGTSFSGKYFELTCDIDLSGHSWEAIGYYSYNDSGYSDGDSSVHLFSGTFDGGGHTIKNITINDSATMRSQGLFGYSDGTIENLSVGCNITGGMWYVGGVCGYNEGAISNCYSSGSVSAAASDNACVGGICGQSDGVISKCGNTAAVSGNSSVGGVCGSLDNTKLTGCWNTGDVTGEDKVGGVCGYANTAEIYYCWNNGNIIFASTSDYYGEIGGVCGFFYDSKMEYCYNKGNVNTDKADVYGNYVGGIVGNVSVNSGSTISKCYNMGGVTGKMHVGGVAGSILSGSVLQDCYNTGDVNGTTQNAGGVVGSDEGTVKNCYNTGNVTGESNVGGVFGQSSSARNCYYLTGTASSGVGNCGVNEEENNIKSLIASEFTNKTKFIGFDFTATWIMGDARPILSGIEESSLNGFGTEASPYIISDLETLKAFRDYINEGNGSGKYFLQIADITMPTDSWTPIGNSNIPFNGTYDGGGTKIIGLNIDNNADCQGLFGYSTGVIKDVGVVDGSVNGYNFVGGICGKNSGDISGCYFTGSVKGEIKIGGISGLNDDGGTVKNCYNIGSVTGTTQSAGGICGANTGSISSCWSAGEVEAPYYAGSVCGDNHATVEKCYYNTDLCTFGDGAGTGLTTIQMTCSDALTSNMTGLGALWSRKDIDKTNTKAYYPYLKVFGEASSPEVGYETDLVIEQVTDSGTTAVLGDKLKFKVSALVKFDGMEDYSADETALTDNGGKFTISYVSGEETVTAVSSTDIPDNTSVTKETSSGVELAGEQIPFTLTYDGTDSDYFASETKTCKVDIGRKTLTAADFDFDAPSDLSYNGEGKTATVTPKSTITGVTAANITVRYFNSTGAELTDGLPTAPGKYSVKIDYTGNANYESESDITDSSWTFTITSAGVTADYFTFTAPSSLDYDGTQKIASVTPAKEGVGTITVKYYDSEGTQLASAPTVPGTYYVKIDTVGSTNYTDVTDYAPNPNTWKFTIEKGTLFVNGTAKASGTYGQTLSQFSFTNKPTVTIGTAAAQTTVEGTWAFVNGNVKPVAGDTHTYRAKFTPSSNSSYYNELTYDFEVVVDKADAVTVEPVIVSYNWAAKGAKSVTVFGLPTDMGNVTLTASVSDTNNIMKTGSVSFSNGKVFFELNGFDSEMHGISAVIDVTLKSDNYEDISFSFTVNIIKKNSQTSTADCELTSTVAADNTYTVTITPVEGAEYRFNSNTQWSNNNTLTGVGHNKEVTGYIRIAATDSTDPGEEKSATLTTGHGNLTFHEAKEASSDATGNIEYWSCDDCGKYFKDADGKEEIELKDTVIPVKGCISNGTDPGKNALHADLDLTPEEIMELIPLTDEEKERIANGENLVVYLVVIDYTPLVTEKEKALMESVLRDGMKIGMYIDIKVYKQIGNDDRTPVDATNGDLKITFEMPESLLNTDSTMERTYYMGRIHDGVPSLIENGTLDSTTNKYSFYSNEFSLYAIVYLDEAIEEEPVETKYPVEIGNSTLIKADKSSAETGERVTISVESGYIAHVYNKKDEEIAKITRTGSFIMPEGGVKITAEYPIDLALTWQNSYIYSYDSNMNKIAVNRTKKQGVITVDLGREYAGKNVTLYKGKKSTKIQVTEGTLDKNGKLTFEVEDGKNYTLVVEE